MFLAVCKKILRNQAVEIFVPEKVAALQSVPRWLQALLAARKWSPGLFVGPTRGQVQSGTFRLGSRRQSMQTESHSKFVWNKDASLPTSDDQTGDYDSSRCWQMREDHVKQNMLSCQKTLCT